jgi:hypothetical protein
MEVKLTKMCVRRDHLRVGRTRREVTFTSPCDIFITGPMSLNYLVWM